MFARRAVESLSVPGMGILLTCNARCDDGKDEKSEKKALQSIFDADALERGAKAVREIDRSANAKAVRCFPAYRTFCITFSLGGLTFFWNFSGTSGIVFVTNPQTQLYKK
jgi:hypothetical protein